MNIPIRFVARRPWLVLIVWFAHLAAAAQPVPDVPPRLLVLPTTDAPARVVIFAEVEPADYDQRVPVAFQYDTGDRTLLSVSRPHFDQTGCPRPAVLADDVYGWAPGWVLASEAHDPRPFGRDAEVVPRQRQTIAVNVTLPAGCTRISGGFDLRLR